jgi:hypothetical protein
VLATIVSTGKAETLIMPHNYVFLLLHGSDVCLLLILDFLMEATEWTSFSCL